MAMAPAVPGEGVEVTEGDRTPRGHGESPISGPAVAFGAIVLGFTVYLIALIVSAEGRRATAPVLFITANLVYLGAWIGATRRWTRDRLRAAHAPPPEALFDRPDVPGAGLPEVSMRIAMRAHVAATLLITAFFLVVLAVEGSSEDGTLGNIPAAERYAQILATGVGDVIGSQVSTVEDARSRLDRLWPATDPFECLHDEEWGWEMSGDIRSGGWSRFIDRVAIEVAYCPHLSADELADFIDGTQRLPEELEQHLQPMIAGMVELDPAARRAAESILRIPVPDPIEVPDYLEEWLEIVVDDDDSG